MVAAVYFGNVATLVVEEVKIEEVSSGRNVSASCRTILIITYRAASFQLSY